jgi:hypothetical protein
MVDWGQRNETRRFGAALLSLPPPYGHDLVFWHILWLPMVSGSSSSGDRGTPSWVDLRGRRPSAVPGFSSCFRRRFAA